ncbi:hypothetical protein Pint_33395 [Pistacia integerrima]|uniref:Uncharacterized protein n=1 Tax=Pistacia integerrima TaxID=434235 RepID=A0ACC0X8B4_9ROSI|nr:hypothetical protein Pint_33395 [Pistacia integerrima]
MVHEATDKIIHCFFGLPIGILLFIAQLCMLSMVTLNVESYGRV